MIDYKFLEDFFYKGLEIFCLCIIGKCININMVVRSGNIKVCKL